MKVAIARGIARFQRDESLPHQAMLLSGSADASKRELAQTIARLAGAAFVPLFPDGSTLSSDELVRRVRDVFADARRLRTVIFVEKSQRVFDAVASLFLAEWDMSGNQRQPWVLAAIESDDKLEPSLRARFGSIIEVPVAESEFVLPESTLAEIHALTESPTRCILLCGPRGSGRTAVSRTIARARGLSFINSHDWHMLSVEKLFAHANASAPSLLLLPDIDGIDAVHARELCTGLADLRTNGAHVVVVATAHDEAQIESTLRGYFDTSVTLPLPDTEVRVELLRRLLRGKQTEFALDDGIYALAEISDGRSVGDLRALVDQATQRATMRAIESADPTATALRLADFT